MNLAEVIKNSNFKPVPGTNMLNIYLNNYSYYIVRNKSFPSKTNIMIDGIFMVNILKIFLKKKILRNSFDFTSNADLVFNYSKKSNRKLIRVGSTESNIKSVEKFLKKKYKIKNISSFNGFDKNLKSILMSHDLDNSLVVIGTGSPHQEDLAKSLFLNFKKIEIYTCGGFFTQTAESLKNKRFNYYPRFFHKYNLRWLYRIYDTNYVLKRLLFYYPISSILLIINLFKYGNKD